MMSTFLFSGRWKLRHYRQHSDEEVDDDSEEEEEEYYSSRRTSECKTRKSKHSDYKSSRSRRHKGRSDSRSPPRKDRDEQKKKSPKKSPRKSLAKSPKKILAKSPKKSPRSKKEKDSRRVELQTEKEHTAKGKHGKEKKDDQKSKKNKGERSKDSSDEKAEGNSHESSEDGSESSINEEVEDNEIENETLSSESQPETARTDMIDKVLKSIRIQNNTKTETTILDLSNFTTKEKIDRSESPDFTKSYFTEVVREASEIRKAESDTEPGQDDSQDSNDFAHDLLEEALDKVDLSEKRTSSVHPSYNVNDNEFDRVSSDGGQGFKPNYVPVSEEDEESEDSVAPPPPPPPPAKPPSSKPGPDQVISAASCPDPQTLYSTSEYHLPFIGPAFQLSPPTPQPNLSSQFGGNNLHFQEQAQFIQPYPYAESMMPVNIPAAYPSGWYGTDSQWQTQFHSYINPYMANSAFQSLSGHGSPNPSFHSSQTEFQSPNKNLKFPALGKQSTPEPPGTEIDLDQNDSLHSLPMELSPARSPLIAPLIAKDIQCSGGVKQQILFQETQVSETAEDKTNSNQTEKSKDLTKSTSKEASVNSSSSHMNWDKYLKVS